LRAFGALSDFEFNLISLFQGFEPLSLNGRVMDEYILSTFHFDKSKTLLIIEPLDSTFCHYTLLENPICKLHPPPDPTKNRKAGGPFAVDPSIPTKYSTTYFVIPMPH
jgi:hypothetical protein